MSELPPADGRSSYVVTYRFTPFIVVVAPFTMMIGAFVLVGAVLSTRSDAESSSEALAKVAAFVMLACGAVFFLGAGLSYLLAAVTRRLALRVDSSGVTLGRAWPPTRAVFVPWPDIDHLVRFAAVNRSGTAQFVGVRLKPGAPPAGSAYARVDQSETAPVQRRVHTLARRPIPQHPRLVAG